MDDLWGPEEWAVAWQSAPAHVREGRRWGGQPDRAENGGGAERRPPDGRPTPPGTQQTRRRSLGRAPTRGAGPATEDVDPGDLERLGCRIRGLAADLASSLREWLHLIGEFDRRGGWADAGLQSCAAWLSWTCSVAPGTAREYVRVARALPLLPLIDEAFAAGRLSYSKVRILIQVAAEVDEAVLLDQAQVQTCSQLERTVRAYRRTDGWDEQRKRRVVWRWDDDGMLVVSARLPADEGAILLAAMERAGDDVVRPSEESCGDENPCDGNDSSGDETPCGDEVPDGDEVSEDGVVPRGDELRSGDEVRSDDGAAEKIERHRMPRPTEEDRKRAALTGADALGTVGADMLVALAQRALAAGDVDSSGDGRHLLVLHADLEELMGDGAPAEAAGHSRTALARARCHLENGPGLDRRTAQRIACDAAIVAVLHHVGEGEPLRLGRKTRAISAAQRRALRIRDGGCRFPGCHRRGHLEAHHVRPWSLLGRTDLENLVLLCRHHHVLMHEGGFRVSAVPSDGWEFYDRRGAKVPVAPVLPGSATGGALPKGAPDPLGLLPGWAGEPFHLAETVAVLARSPRDDAA